jgi:cytochrome c oxidase subunit 2
MSLRVLAGASLFVAALAFVDFPAGAQDESAPLLAADLAAATAPEIARGADLFELCSTCHGTDGAGNREFLAPSIAGMDSTYVFVQLQKFRDGRRGTQFDDMSSMRMRPMALTLGSEADVEAVAKYVAQLPAATPPPQVTGDAARGKELYTLTCTACHGPTGEGVKAIHGGPLTFSSDWYILDQIKKFRAGTRGADPRDPIAIMMRPLVLALPDEQAMLDVVAYVNTFSQTTEPSR